jgi:hypothetical protein
MRRVTATGSAAVPALLSLLAIGACTSSSEPTPPPPRTAVSLSTHCGIDDLEVDGRWYERVGGRLDDGQGNPPAGWADPTQSGVVAVAGDTLVFSDDSGHRESFRPRPAATGPKRGCA